MNNIKKSFLKNIIWVIALIIIGCNVKRQPEKSLKSAFEGKFLIGVAMSHKQVIGKDSMGLDTIVKYFNSVVCENDMKPIYIQPVPGKFNFNAVDSFIRFGEENNMFIVGHTLVWHSQSPDWFFTDSLGNNVSREVLIERMRNHILTFVGRYKGRVKGWDVVNEAIEDDGAFRKSLYYQILGEDFIKLAFQFAHEADPAAELYYNDFNMYKEGKRNAVVKLVNDLKKDGIRIDAVGMQGHLVMDTPIDEFEKSIISFSQTGVKVMVTELDLSVLPFPEFEEGAEISLNYEYRQELNPYPDKLPDSVYIAFQNKYLEFFNLFLKHSDVISRVTVWGLHDGLSWKNNFPVHRRTDYPLLFDRQRNPKPLVFELIKAAEQTKKEANK